MGNRAVISFKCEDQNGFWPSIYLEMVEMNKKKQSKVFKDNFKSRL